jgi:hypothetical protein
MPPELTEANLLELIRWAQGRVPHHQFALDMTPEVLAPRPVRVEAANFLAVTEIASLGGLVPTPLPAEFQQLTGELLRNIATHLPWAPSSPRSRLLEAFSHRLLGNGIRSIGSDIELEAGGVVEPAGILGEFLAMNDSLRADPTVAEFLGSLACPPPVWTSRFETILLSREAFLRELERAGEEEQSGEGNDRELAQCLVGFGHYMAALQQLLGLLHLTRGRPMFQSGMWHYHASVFGVSQARVRLYRWLEAAQEHLGPALGDGDSNWFSRAKQVLDELTSDGHDQALAAALKLRRGPPTRTSGSGSPKVRLPFDPTTSWLPPQGKTTIGEEDSVFA